MNERNQDPILLEVMRCQLQGVVEEMGEMVMRCGHTVFVKETQDFVVAVVTPEGEVVACSKRMGIWIAIGQNFRSVIEAGGPYREGDVWFTNDPEESRGLVTHLPDTFCWRPIFHEGKLFCFVAAFIHFTDVGGLAPGSVAPSAVDQFQEGTIVPVTRLVAEGRMREDILRIFTRNSRSPEKSRGDMLALLGALNRGESRMRQLIGKFGGEPLAGGLKWTLDYAERQARAIVREIPDGAHRFWDYLEGDFMPGSRPVRICVTLRIDGDRLTVDFAGTDPQVSAAFNIPSWGMDGHYLLVMGLINYMRTVNPDLVYNSGLVRPVHFDIPKGSLLNPEPNAPCGARQATFFRVADAFLGALCVAMPDRLPAAGCGQGSIMLVSTPDVATGRRLVSIVQPLVGGSGGRPRDDGTDGVDFATGFYRNIPTEVLESEMPVLVDEYGLRPDSGGAGRTRGGMGIRYALRVLSPGSLVTSRGLERYRFAPWGRKGGAPGANGRTTLRLPGEEERSIGKIDVLSLPAQGAVVMETAGGGGFGPPWERPPHDVLRDLEDGLVSEEAAERWYGVVVTRGTVDADATEKRRAQMRREGKDAGPFSWGDARVEFEKAWPDDLQRNVNDATEGIPAMIREHVRLELMEWLESGNGGNSSPNAIRAKVAEILGALAPPSGNPTSSESHQEQTPIRKR